jgi:hypothetical protein
MNNNIPSFDEIEKGYNNIQELSHQYWIHQSLFSFNWWFLIVLMIFVWSIWLKFVNKSKLVEIMLGGCFISIVTLLLDLLGVNLDLWDYPTLIISSFYPTLLPVDVVVIPVTYMLMYQYFQSWKSFSFASVFVSAIYSFVVEPGFHWLDIYRLMHWKYIYSFPIYIILFLFIRWFVVSMKTIQRNNNV